MSQQFEDCIVVARSELSVARQLLNDDISRYPTPISGCDAQFNYLLAEREKVGAALRKLDEMIFVPTPRTPDEFAGVESQ